MEENNVNGVNASNANNCVSSCVSAETSDHVFTIRIPKKAIRKIFKLILPILLIFSVLLNFTLMSHLRRMRSFGSARMYRYNVWNDYEGENGVWESHSEWNGRDRSDDIRGGRIIIESPDMPEMPQSPRFKSGR